MQTAALPTLRREQLTAAFEAPAAPTVGVEEEVMLLDPATGDLRACAKAVLGRLGDDPRFKLELPAAQLEILTTPLLGPAEVERELLKARRSLVAAADGEALVAAAGVHPFAAAEGELNPGERYAGIRAEYGPVASRQLVFALQVHVAVRGARRALAVYNALRSHLPEIAALAANAPIYDGRDSGLASVRPTICEQLPRQGVPPPLASWDEFAGALEWGRAAGSVPEFGQWWWELRLHPVHGTLELRVPDAQLTAADSAAVVAVIQSLALALAARHDAGESLPVAPTWRIEENRWSALRHGLDGTLTDLRSGRRAPTRERLAVLLDELEPIAVGLGAGPQLERARSLAQANGAQRQREAARELGVRGLAGWLVERFSTAAAG